MALEDGLTVDLLTEVVSISTGSVTSSENVENVSFLVIFLLNEFYVKF